MVGARSLRMKPTRTHFIFLLGILLGFLLSVFLPRTPPPPPPPRVKTVEKTVQKVLPCSKEKQVCKTNDSQFVLKLPPSFRNRRRFSSDEVRRSLRNPTFQTIYNDLQAFTGLTDSELMTRLMRNDHHHFVFEHLLANPQSSNELTFYYRSSVAYLFGNVMHLARDSAGMNVTKADAPVLDYSGGVGNQVIHFARKGIRSVYFGIGLMEFEFARFRVRRHGLEDLVQFVEPYVRDEKQGLRFDPMLALQKEKNIGDLGAVLALDVFEHIPNYEITARFLARLIRKGGKMIENTPFEKWSDKENALHLKASVSMEEALSGFKKVYTGVPNVWIKQSD